jgi:hypothetical protein
VHANARILAALAVGIGIVAVAAYLLIMTTLNSTSYEAKLKGFAHSQQSCAKSGGTWTHGPFGESICERGTSDSGKYCESADQCEGACVAEKGAGPKAASGTCSAHLHVYGCNTFVEHAGTYTMCRD